MIRGTVSVSDIQSVFYRAGEVVLRKAHRFREGLPLRLIRRYRRRQRTAGSVGRLPVEPLMRENAELLSVEQHVRSVAGEVSALDAQTG